MKILVRDPVKARTFKEKFGIDAVVGSHKDVDKLETLTSEADYIFAIVNIQSYSCYFLCLPTSATKLGGQ